MTVYKGVYMLNTELKGDWDKVYEVPDGWYPNEFLVRFLAKYVKKRDGLTSYKVFRPDIQRILDLGCGSGKHIVMLAKEGFATAGIDVSSKAVDFAKMWVRHKGLSADLRVGTAQNLPWEDSSFDTVVSLGVLDHMKRSDAIEAINDVHRVLCHRGLFFLSLASTEDFGYGRGQEIEPQTYIINEGVETGLIQRFYFLDEIFELMEEKFNILDIVHDCWQPCHGEGFSLVDVESVNKMARYHIAAEIKNKK